jgi:hypothetical protein
MDQSEQRETFRVETRLDAELFHDGDVAPCSVRNLSAGGALVETVLALDPPARCTLGLRLGPQWAKSAGMDYVTFHLEVLDRTELEDDVDADTGEPAEPLHVLRMRNLTEADSPAWERAHKVVFEAQRQQLAERSGSDHASPMASDRERRRALRRQSRPRYRKAALRPDLPDDS